MSEVSSLKELRQYLREHDEDSNIELKLLIDDQKKQLIEPIVGFANGLGGVLILGVNPKSKKLVGIGDDKDTINNWISDLVKPPLGNAYKMNSFRVTNNNFVYIFQIKSSPLVHAAKIKDHYVYYARKGSSTRQLTPEELNRLAHVKERYRSNEEFRRGLVSVVDSTITELSHFLNASDVTSLTSSNEDLVRSIREAKAKSINVNVLTCVIDFYENLNYYERNCPHVSLGHEEEKCLATLRSDFHLIVWQDRRLDLSKIETWRSEIDSELQIRLDENFLTDLSFVHELGIILGPIGQRKLLDDEAASNLRGMFFSYDVTMNDIFHRVAEMAESTPNRLLSSIVKESLSHMNRQIPRYAKHLTEIVKHLAELKNSVQSSLDLVG